MAFDFHSELHRDRVTSWARKGVAGLIQHARKAWAATCKLRMMARSLLWAGGGRVPGHARSRHGPRPTAKNVVPS